MDYTDNKIIGHDKNAHAPSKWTLRDEIAMRSLASIIQEGNSPMSHLNNNQKARDWYAELAYKMADTMLNAREQ